jgi:hypothetical protein
MFFSSVFTASLNGNDLRLQKRIIELKPHINVRKSSIYADDALSIEAWGDSLTYGTGVSNYDYTKAYPAILSSLTGYNVLNYGVGGETIETILGRMGAYPIMVCPAVGGTITIPADSNTAVSINLKSITGTNASPLLQSANAEKGVNPCSINNVLGTLTYNSASGGYTFQRLTSGSEITISSPVPLVTKYM